jgi:hypothetical protein
VPITQSMSKCSWRQQTQLRVHRLVILPTLRSGIRTVSIVSRDGWRVYIHGTLQRTSLDNRTMTQVTSRIRLYSMTLQKLIGKYQFHFRIVSYMILLATFPISSTQWCWTWTVAYILLKPFFEKGRLPMPKINKVYYKYVQFSDNQKLYAHQ